jgi:PAS domain-containing protein
LQTYSPAAVLTNANGDILYVSGHMGKYLEVPSGKANWNIFVMAREGLRYELSGAFQKALRGQETITLKNLVVGTNGGTQIVNVTIQPIREKNALRGMVMIVFTDVAAPTIVKAGGKPGHVTAKSAHTDELERELNHAHQEVQSIREEMQTSQEELKSANEELQSTNEELQSTNEELTTSKEEMQSMNEELHSVNNEMQANLDELSHTNSDLKNLLDSTDIATLFLDNTLRVRRFTSQTSKITQLIPADVGRPITDIASALLYPQLADDAREVLRTLIKLDRQIATPNGDWFAARVLPYCTLENMIDGVVITFVDITEIKRLELELIRTSDLLERTGKMAKVGGWELDLVTLRVALSAEAARIHEVDLPYVAPLLETGSDFYSTEDWPVIQSAVQAAIDHGTSYDLESPFITAKGRHIWVRVQGFAVMENGKATKLHGIIQDITDRKQVEEEIHRLNEELEQRVIERTAQLKAANMELAIQNEEKEKRAAELVIANAYLEKLTAEMKK